ncbi:hypothetical protein C8J57DRAFT_1593238 [Mycena rebaudengoi]|nr:hypothetical protein C8J57DRAFT_1593238 [Mycena rebaudengoi]
MLRYYTAHALSAEVLAQDPTERDRLDKELRSWDEALSQEPQTFKDHFLHFQYAVSAAMYYDRDIVTVAMQNHGSEFENFFRATLDARFQTVKDGILEARPRQVTSSSSNAHTLNSPTHRHHEHEPPSSEIPNLDLDGAKALLATPEILLSLQFYERNSVESCAGSWKVESVSQHQTRHGKTVAFKVQFMIIDTVLELPEDALLDLMVSSCIYPC